MTIENESNHYERAKYVITRNLFTFLTFLLLLLGILNLSQGDINMYPILGGGISSAIILILLYKSGKYNPAAIVAIFLSYTLTIYNLMIISEFGHFVDFFWIMIISTYTFFTLGRNWGLINLFTNIFTAVLIFYLSRVEIIERYPKDYTNFSQINFVINITVSAIVFSYIILIMIKKMKRAEEKYVIANAELSFINEEKTVMLKEIHHRVKNNLQVVTSLLRLQANEIEDQKTRFHLTDSVNRVSAMAMIHEKMYQSENLTKIDLKIYLKSLVDDLITSYVNNVKINVVIESDLNRVEPKSLVPLALIFNELVSNSIKHAFKGRTEGKIIIQTIRNLDGSIQIKYHDDGEWIGPQKEGSFGLEMIETFTEQLDGKMERKIDNGTNYIFLFPTIL